GGTPRTRRDVVLPLRLGPWLRRCRSFSAARVGLVRRSSGLLRFSPLPAGGRLLDDARGLSPDRRLGGDLWWAIRRAPASRPGDHFGPAIGVVAPRPKRRLPALP